MDEPIALATTLISGGLLALSIAADSALQHYSHSRLDKLLGDPGRLQAVSQRLKNFDAMVLSICLLEALLSLVFLGALLEYRLKLEDASRVTTLLLATGVYVILLQGILRAVVTRAAERVLLLLLPFVEVADKVVAVIRAPIDLVGFVIGRSIGAEDAANEKAEALSEVLDAVAEGEADGHIEETAADFIENIMEYKDRVVREVMTPRTSMVCVPQDAKVEDVLSLVAEHGYSKIPVYGDNRDDIVGVVFLKDVVRRGKGKPRPEACAKDLARRAFFVPESKKVSDLLREFQQQKSQIAIVLDEFGGTSGLVTVEDIVEEIVGELEDEFDAAGGEPEIRRLDDQNFEIDAKTTIETLNEILPITIPEDGDYETVGGFLSARLGKVPETGEQYEMDGVEFVITAADERRVERVKITTLSEPPPA
ncbi:MAG: hemolysin family protein [Planctomycetota bacterium]